MSLVRSTSYVTSQVEHLGLAKSFSVLAEGVNWSITSEHSGWEIILTENDAIEFGFRGQKHVLQPHHLFIYNARESHSEIYDGVSKHFKALVIDPKYIDELLMDIGRTADEILFDDFQLKLSPQDVLSLRSFDRSRSFGGPSLFYADCVLSHLLSKIVNSQRNTASNQLRDAAKTGHYPCSIDRVKTIIYEHAFDENMTLQILADRAKISKFHLVRSFKQRVGVTPMDYLWQIRTEWARQMLASGRTNITEIAFAVGFRDISAFNRRFRRVFNFTPSQFRAILKTGS